MSSKADIFEERAALMKSPQGDIFEERAQFYEPEPREPSNLKEIPTHGVKGAAKGLFGTYGDILEALGMREVAARQIGLPTEFVNIPTSEDVASFLEKVGFPEQPETAGGRYAGRIGESVGGALAFGSPLRALGAFAGGSALGQTAEELGASPEASGIVELLGTLLGGGISKKVLPRSKEAQELAQKARDLGFKEKEIAPLVKPKRRFETAAKLARKGGKLGELSRDIENKLGDSYKFVKEAARKEGRISFKQRGNLVKNFEDKIKELSKSASPSADKKKAIKILQESAQSMRNKVPTYETLIDSYQDINQASPGVRKILRGAKDEYTKILGEGSPQLAKDFAATNQVYTQFKDRLGKLKPEQYDSFWDKLELWEIGGGLAGAAMGYPWALAPAIGHVGTRSLANQYLTNPYFQNLPNKFMKAVLKDDKKTATAIANSLKKVLKRDYDLQEEELEKR